MATWQEKVDLARRLASGSLAVDMCTEWDAWTKQERDETFALALYIVEIERHRTSKTKMRARRRAQRLLRSWLSPQQRAQLARTGEFLVRGSAGGVYRIRPSVGHTDRVERHGKHWFAKASYCLHDYPVELPEPAPGPMPDQDLALAHALLISVDEPAFLRDANATERKPWDGAWRRRLNVARRLRAEGVSEDDITRRIDEVLNERRSRHDGGDSEPAAVPGPEADADAARG